MWIITTYPDIVRSYKQCDDANPFQPITVQCAIPASETKYDSNKLSAVITYKTRYCDKDGKLIMVLFGLGETITVNAIIGFSIL